MQALLDEAVSCTQWSLPHLRLLLLLLVVLLAQDAPHRIFEFNRNGGLWTINGEGWATATIAGDTFLSEKADQTALSYSP
jgi:hypothetical protein